MYPVVIVDNFFSDPDTIVNLTKQYPFYKDVEGRWPGKRTQCLSKINNSLYNELKVQICDVYQEDASKWNLKINFQRTFPFTKFNRGWIHRDYSSDFGGIIYLNKNPDNHTGTSVYDLIDKNFVASKESLLQKSLFYRGKEIDDSEYEKQWNCVNSQYIVTKKVENVYNRLMAFGSHVHHGVQTFGHSQPRLTISFFAKSND
tara:strand:+ start:288 stop:893 length:606 start_codon:yes stop_codon:yes gene_type:complete